MAYADVYIYIYTVDIMLFVRSPHHFPTNALDISQELMSAERKGDKPHDFGCSYF